MRIYKGEALWICAALTGGLLLSGCGFDSAASGSTDSSEDTAVSGSATTTGSTGTAADTEGSGNVSMSAGDVDVSEMFSDRDYEIGYDESECASVILDSGSASSDSSAVVISGSAVTITDEGTYILSGTLENGMVIVDADDTDKVQLVLDGASINCEHSAALYIREADKVFVTTAPDSQNTLSSTGDYEAIDDNNIDAAIFSKADLTLNGSGTLSVSSEAGHGIVSKDDLAVTSGTYEINAASHGLSGKDSIRIANGTFTIDSGKDGIHGENADDASLGFVYIQDGSFSLTCGGDGISAEIYALLAGGEYDILAGDGSGSAEIQRDQIEAMEPGNAAGSGSSGTDGSSAGANEVSTSTNEASTSTKGIKTAGTLMITAGTFDIDSADDALHSNGDVQITGGSFTIATGDDGIHADGSLVIADGDMTITQSYEGLEGLTIDISGGTIDLTASDDGLNAAGGSDESGYSGFGGGFRGADGFEEDAGAYIAISGGTLYIDASGDGIDSNGSLTVSGGEIYVSGPDNGGNGALDYASEATISGGIFVAAGASQMAQNFGSSSTQGVMLVTVSAQASRSTVTLYDAQGEALVSWTPAKAYDSVVISCPEITAGQTYTLVTGDDETEITMDSLVYGSQGAGMGGMGGQPGGGRGDGGMAPGSGEMEAPGSINPGSGMGDPGSMAPGSGEMGDPGNIQPGGQMNREPGGFEENEPESEAVEGSQLESL